MTINNGRVIAFPGAEAQPFGLTIVVPAYNEAEALPHTHQKLLAFARSLKEKRGLAVEILYVDDGSRDGTLAVANALAADGADVQVLSFSRNFGKEAALLAGLDNARYGAVIFMDADGQHPTSIAETLVSRWLDDGYDVAFTYKAHRRDEPKLRTLFVNAFYGLVNSGVRHKIPADAGDFRLLSPRAAAALRQLPERGRFFKGLSSWVGFRQIGVPYEPDPRLQGEAKWSFLGLLAFSIEGLTSFSIVPLRMASLFGAVLATFAFLYGLVIVIETLVFGHNVPGYPSLFVGMMFIGGVQLLMIGVLGEYIGKILSEMKGRPVYLVGEQSLKRASEQPASERGQSTKSGE
ncbi:glycosyltransferase family 2 protein [Phreatobacter aquaticus]|uniref:Glycosyltransferase family 2 protein n=1 Tax=Phreatobacter aquaticus TaxID=2570229 RepID=A0A4D7QJB1_9HYPH|nr:glycosyltransferase family 2 protein [Phreatobacter aquaticus]QCK85993.1 glycosyltransferase family 2 protein [Phreatobacter aquaticus]